MAGYGKNSRGGKRGSSSSSSSYVSMTTMLLVLACCVFAVYVLTSSSITPPHATPASNNASHHHHKRNAVPLPPRTILREPPPAAEAHEDTQGDLPEDAVKGHHESISSLTNMQEEVTNDSAGTEEDSRSEIEAVQHEKQQQEDVETNPEKPLHEEEVETRLRHDQSYDHAQQHVQEDQAHEQLEQQHEEINQNQAEEQQQDDTVNGQSNEEQQQEQQSYEENSEQHQQQHEQHGEEQSNTENQQQQQQEQSETNGEEGHRDETNNNESLQQSIDEMDNNHGKNQPQIIQQVTEESNTQLEEGEGISSQSQIEHDTDGTIEDHQQQEQQQEQQEEEQQQEQQQQQQEEEEHHQEQQQQEQQQQQQQQQQQKEEQQEQQQEQQQQDSLQPQQTEDKSNAGGSNENNQPNEDNLNVNDSLPDGGQSTVPVENKGDKKTWATQADQSSSEKERRKGEGSSQSNEGEGDDGGNGDAGKSAGQEWELCNVTAGPDYIPCLDNEKAIKQLRSFRHFEHRERHCPEESPNCLVPLPMGYKRSIQWPQSRDRIWYNNVPRTKLAEVKGHQNWVKVTGEYLTFPGGGTQFIHGALHYIDFIQQSVPEIAWGKHTRVVLDVGCGVASFGGYLFERDVLAMSFAPKDEHEAQVQFALERGIPAISAVMGSQRLPFPSRVFDIVHCARCRVPWHANDGALLLELNRVLRPGGFFVWSATPVYQKLKEDVEIWEAMTALTKSMCWELFTIKKDKLNSVGAAMYRKPVTNDCYENRNEQKPPMCKEDDDPNAAWYVPLQSCMHRVPVDRSVRGSQWPLEWPRRAEVPPYWLNSSQMGVYGRPAPDDFTKDYAHWRRVVNKSYLNGFGIDWSKVRNVMDMRAVYGGFAAALKDMKVWVMNLVNIESPDTLPIIYERGLFGMYHDWCESFSTYPRTYDLLHADHLFSQVRKRCKILPVVAEVDRITRPGGKLIVRDESDVVGEVENLVKSLHWEIRLTYSRNNEGILCAEKSDWRPEKISSST